MRRTKSKEHIALEVISKQNNIIEREFRSDSAECPGQRRTMRKYPLVPTSKQTFIINENKYL